MGSWFGFQIVQLLSAARCVTNTMSDILKIAAKFIDVLHQ
jgi:hypothetical protein